MARTYKRDSRGRFASTNSGGGGGKKTAPGGRDKPAAKPKPKQPARSAPKSAPAARQKPAAKPKAAPTRSKPATKPKAAAAAKTAKTLKARKRLTTRRIENGTLKGQTIVRSVVRQRVQREEARIKGSGVENAVMVNRRGRVVYRGTENKVNSVKMGEKGKFYGDRLTITHNHPEAGNPGHNPRVRGSRLTAGLSPGDISGAIKRSVREVRAVGETRKYSFKPDYVNVKNVGSVPKMAKTYQDDIQRSFAAGTDRRIRVSMQVMQNFNDRIAKASQQWWNPAQRVKAAKLKRMKQRAEAALAATAHYQDQANAMRELRSRGYNINARRNRALVTGTTQPRRRRRR